MFIIRLPAATKKIKRYNRIYFKTKAQARAHGYMLCKICRP
ncbi:MULTISPECIES: Ada metal-binding domain-containing protein [Methanobacterium]